MRLSVLAILGGWCAHKEVILLLGVGGGKLCHEHIEFCKPVLLAV